MKHIVRLLRWTLWSLVLFFLLVVLLLATLSWTLPPLAKKMAAPYDIALDIGSADINIFRGNLALHNIDMRAVAASESFTLRELQIDLAMLALLRDRIVRVDRILLQDGYVPLSDKASGQAPPLLAGIDFAALAAGDEPTQTTQTKPDTTEGQAPDILLTEFLLRDVVIDYQRDDTPLRAALRSIHLQDFASSPADSKGLLDIDANLVGADIAFTGTATPFANSPILDGKAELDIDDIAGLVTTVRGLDIELPEITHALSGALAANTSLRAEYLEQRLQLALQNFNFAGQEINANLGDEQQPMPLMATFSLALSDFDLSTSPTRFRASDIVFESPSLQLIDNSVDPPAAIALDALQLTIDQLDSNDPQAASSIVLATSLGSYGKIDATANASLLDIKQQAEWTIKGEQLKLPTFSGYAKKAINKHIDRGALDFNFDGSIKQQQVDSALRLQAHQLALTGNSGGERTLSSFENELGMPLNTALALLRDKDDTVRLKIPVQGTTDQLDVDIGGIARKAVLNTIKTAALTQFGPLLALSALDKARSLGDALQLKPVLYASGSDTLGDSADTATALDTLDNIGKLLSKRPKIKLNICGVATPSEVLALSENAKKSTKKDGKKRQKRQKQPKKTDVPGEQLDAASLTKLRQLADLRAENAKHLLIARDIDGKRLILCAPRIDRSKTGLPRVDFSL